MFRRARAAHFDREGFESYKLACSSCGAFLAGVIDPFDGTLLLSGAREATSRAEKESASASTTCRG